MQAACRKDICAAYSNSQVLNLGASARQLLVQHSITVQRERLASICKPMKRVGQQKHSFSSNVDSLNIGEEDLIDFLRSC
jgi:hypothetical protein